MGWAHGVGTWSHALMAGGGSGPQALVVLCRRRHRCTCDEQRPDAQRGAAQWIKGLVTRRGPCYTALGARLEGGHPQEQATLPTEGRLLCPPRRRNCNAPSPGAFR